MVLMRYSASEPGMLSLRPGDKVVVYSYPAGDNPSLIGVEVGVQNVTKHQRRSFRSLGIRWHIITCYNVLTMQNTPMHYNTMVNVLAKSSVNV